MGTRRRAAHDHRSLQIRTRTELAGNGDNVTIHSVHCPRQHLSVPVRECAACSRCSALFVGPHDDQVLCAAAPDTEPEHRSLRKAAEGSPVSSIMTNDVVCVREDVSLESITSLLLERGFTGLPVIDEEGRAIGIISSTDLVRHQYEEASSSSTEGDDDMALESGLHATGATSTVADVMTPIAITVPEEASISSAAVVMAARNIHRLPVVDDCGTVVGLITTTDIVDWVAQGAPRKLWKRDAARS